VKAPLPAPELLVFWAGTEEPFLPGHKSRHLTDEFYTIEFCYRGEGDLTINGTPHRVKKGDCFFSFPGCLVEFCADEHDPWAKSWASFSGDSVNAYLAALGITPERPILHCGERTEILNCINQMFDEVNKSYDNLLTARFKQSEWANRLFAFIAEIADGACEPRQGSVAECYVERALRLIENAVIAGEGDLSVNGLASILGLNRAYFSSIFVKHTGKAPQQYIIERKMQQACTLFASPLSTAANVASTLGYDPAPFGRVFKRVVGMTPMEYKKSLGGV